MNTAVFLKEIREARWKLIVGTVVLTVFGIALPFIFSIIDELMLQIPPGFERLMQPEMLDNYTIFLWSQWNAKNLYQFGTLLAILLGMSTIAGEVANQTMSFLLTRPLSRKEVFLSKVAAGVLLLTLAVLLSTSFMLAAASIVTAQVVEAGIITVATLVTWLGLIAIYLLTVFISTIIDDPVKAGGITAVVLVGFAMFGWFNMTKELSLFTHISGGSYVLGGGFPLGPVIAILLFSLAMLAAGMNIMERKEF